MDENIQGVSRTEIVLPAEDDFFTQEAYKALRTNLQFCGANVKVIAFTSCNENEGKSSVSLNVAKSFADLKKNVLFIDADMRKSVLAGRNTKLQNVHSGLSELLTGMASLKDCVLATQYPSLYLLLAGQYPPNPVELLNGGPFQKLVQLAKNNFDYVIIDTPPLGEVIDAAVIATQCDGTVLVVSEGRAHARQAKDVIDQLEKSNCKVLGAVRNKVPKRAGGKYYSKYWYGYGYGYGNDKRKSSKGRSKSKAGK